MTYSDKDQEQQALENIVRNQAINTLTNLDLMKKSQLDESNISNIASSYQMSQNSMNQDGKKRVSYSEEAFSDKQLDHQKLSGYDALKESVAKLSESPVVMAQKELLKKTGDSESNFDRDKMHHYFDMIEEEMKKINQRTSEVLSNNPAHNYLQYKGIIESTKSAAEHFIKHDLKKKNDVGF